MGLLEDIQNGVIDPEQKLSVVLRKLRVLSNRTGSESLEQWVIWESDGYDNRDNVPDYRRWPLEVKGHFSGPFGSGIENAPIPFAVLPEVACEVYQDWCCTQSIASIESTIDAKPTAPLRVSTGDLSLLLGKNVYGGQNCVQCWGEFSVGHLVELENAVRNRVLELTLALVKKDPSTGEAIIDGSGRGTAERVSQIFNTTVYGGAANLVGSATESTVNFEVNVGDVEAIRQMLKAHSAPEKEINSLVEALADEPNQNDDGSLGPKVTSAIGRLVSKAADGSWNVGIATAGNLLAAAIGKFYGG